MIPAPIVAENARRAELLGEQTKRLEALVFEHEMAIEKYMSRLDELERDHEPTSILVRCQIEYLILSARGQIYQYQQSLDSARELIESLKNPPSRTAFSPFGPPTHLGLPILSTCCNRCRKNFSRDGMIVGSDNPEQLSAMAVEDGWKMERSPGGFDVHICPECQKRAAE